MNKYILIVGLCGDSYFLKTDHFNNIEETIVIDDIHIEPGGKGYNQAIAIKKIGGSVHFIGARGINDNSLCEDYLKNMEIPYSFLEYKNIMNTKAFIKTDKNGDNQVSVYPGATALIKKEDIEKFQNLIEKAIIILLTEEIPYEAFDYILSVATKCNIFKIVNPAPFKGYSSKHSSDIDLLTPNFNEASLILNLDNPSISTLLTKLDTYNRDIIVTLGKNGAILKSDKTKILLPPIKTYQVVDTTGAGDIFNGTLSALLLQGKSLMEATIYALFASGKSVTTSYVMPSIPSLFDLFDFLYVKDREYEYSFYNHVRRTSRAFLINEDNLFGLLKIEGNDIFGMRQHLETVGGMIENDESDEECIRREILEETGYKLKSSKSIGYVVSETNLLNRITYAHYFICYVDTSSKTKLKRTNKEKELIKDIKWMSLVELQKELEHTSSKCDRYVHNIIKNALTFITKSSGRFTL